jgi:hypothetical protein
MPVMMPVRMDPDRAQLEDAKEPQGIPAWSTVGAQPRAEGIGSLAEALDRLLTIGVSIDGAATIGVAGVDLVMLDLRLLLGAIDTVCPEGSFFCGRPSVDAPPRPPAPPNGMAGSGQLSSATRASPGEGAFVSSPMSQPPAATMPGEEPVGNQRPQHGLMKLALTLVNLLHEVLERQAVRRMGNGTLTPVQIENVGLALYAQAMEIAQLRKQFGLSDTDLQLRLSTGG